LIIKVHQDIPQGFLLINKPSGISSFGCVLHLKKFIGKKIKIGYAGTLDPFASGLLVVAIGRKATRSISSIVTMDKAYIAMGKLGEMTDTFDYTGNIIDTNSKKISEDVIRNVVNSFNTSYEQIPPIYSALKYKGTPLYKLARKSQINASEIESIIQKKRRTVYIHELKLISFDFPFFTISACVSHGTYIRSLINDIALSVGSFATTYSLERISIGSFSLENAIEPRKMQNIVDINRFILSDF